ncbi:response regulator [Microvirga sp. P5_D2]
MSAASVTVLPRRTPPTILVVEDDVLARCLISDELRIQGYKVLEASTADDALSVLEAIRVDLLFADIHLPGQRNGLDVARIVHQRQWPTQVVLTSGRESTSTVPELDSLGIFICKPYLLSHVLEVVSHCLNWPEMPLR